VHEDTKARILKAAKELDYYPNANARNLKTKKTGNVGVFIYGFGGPIFSDVLEGIRHELQKQAYNIIVTSGKASNVLLKERQVDAAIVFDSKLDDDILVQYAKIAPLIVLDRTLIAENIYHSMINNEDLVGLFIKKMIEKGYKKFSYLSGPSDAYNNQERLIGFNKALKKHDLEMNRLFEADFTIAGGHKIATSMTVENEQEFIFCANDESAIGLIQGLNERNIKVPDQIAVSGFDGIYLGQFIKPKLSTISIDHYGWGKEIAKFVVAKLKNQPQEPLESPKATMILRESC
ncbi:MAG TPA: LacI family DNA-binding transcriptional regulator, partial [Acholeplasma sp.]|nr:LacI family DNA-binding transcriptional regulator [Acholeplasma sp.]